MRVAVIGAGPAGNYSAYLLAKKGYSVDIFEKKPVVGPPVQCTGILSDYFTTIMKPKDDFVENTVTKTRIYAPDGNFVETRIKKNYVICRKKFDSYLADMAISEGAKLHLNHSFHGLRKNAQTIKMNINNKNTNISKETDILIGADGPMSPVAKSAGIYNNREFVIGAQIEVKHKNDNVVEFYPYIGCYAWIVPKNEVVVRIGVASYKNTTELFKKFVASKIGKNYDKKTIENQSGIIPIFNPKVKAQKENIYLTGDAATFLKATTGGGINQSLKAGHILANSIEKEKNYDNAWRNAMFNNLFAHLIIHKMMIKFNDNDWNNLVNIFSERKMKELLYEESRDKLVPMLLKIAYKNPRVFNYIKYLPYGEIKKAVF